MATAGPKAPPVAGKTSRFGRYNSPLPCSAVVSILRRISVFTVFPVVQQNTGQQNTGQQDTGKLAATARLALAAAALSLLVPLAVACWLRPNPNGFGTHRQLGLPPCTFMWLFGTRCPSCGMTTSWSHAVRGQWWQAIGCNAGGALLAAMAMTAGPWLFVSAARGRWLVARPSDRLVAVLATAVIAITLLDWLYRLGIQG